MSSISPESSGEARDRNPPAMGNGGTSKISLTAFHEKKCQKPRWEEAEIGGGRGGKEGQAKRFDSWCMVEWNSFDLLTETLPAPTHVTVNAGGGKRPI